MSETLNAPKLEPSGHCWTILQDHGPRDGGWGPAGVSLLGLEPRPWVYTGDAPHVIEWAKTVCAALAEATGKATVLARYTVREDVFSAGGS